MPEFALPLPGFPDGSLNCFQRTGKPGLQQFVGDLAQGLISRPPIEILRPAVPEQYPAVQIADQDRILRQVEQGSLFSQFLLRLPAGGDVPENAQHAERVAVQIAEGCLHLLRHPCLPVVRELLHTLFSDPRLHYSLVIGAVFLRQRRIEKIVVALPGELFRADAQQLGIIRIAGDIAGASVLGENHLGKALEQRAVSVFALSCRFFRLFADLLVA